MTPRAMGALLMGLSGFLAGWTTGSRLLSLCGAALLAALLLSLASVIVGTLTLSFTQQLSVREVPRLTPCILKCRFFMLSLLPLDCLSCQLTLDSGRQVRMQLRARPWGQTLFSCTLPCRHMGLYPVGVTEISLRDCFGFFNLRRRNHAPLPQLLVLPLEHSAREVSFSAQEGEGQALSRSQSDFTTPDGIRPWQNGDELKRVHWKLSARRQSLVVRTYEPPQKPDALVLLNAHAPATLSLRDELAERCCGYLHQLLSAGHMTRFPLGESGQEFSERTPQGYAAIRHALAAYPFRDVQPFEDILAQIAPRMGRTGAVLIFSCELTPPIADAVIALAPLGARIEFTLITSRAPSQTQRQLLRLLVASNISAHDVEGGEGES